MIVISIIIILAAITLPQYQKTIMHTRETVLKDDLRKMRSLIDQFAADKGRLPQSLDDLATKATCAKFRSTRSRDRKTGPLPPAKIPIHSKASRA